MLRLLLCWTLVSGLGGASLGVSVAQTQPAGSESCEARLAEAQRQYVAQDYAAVESLVLPCVERLDADAADVQAGYRLLALAFIRQDLLHEAQMTVLKLLGADYAYEPDPVQDPPFYVALVASIKEQLRVSTPRAAPSARAATPAATVNVNTATAAELEAVPGIGPVMAGRIVESRRQQGAFQRLDDLDRVSGIGERTLARLAPYLTVGPEVQTFRAAGGVPVAPPATATDAPPAANPTGVRVNVNTASAAELETLNGIGPALAARIIAHREAAGPFRSVEALVEVRGIGPRTLERLVPFVTVGDTP